ncbi:MAG: V-type ATP synthase subunit C [Clostridia bacterium]|nr:V-type ATP synthase subunit C [Clostridia bacterium]
MPKLKDTDYLTISTRIRAMENRLLTKERRERMLDARDNAEAAKILTECGYGELSALTPAGLEELLGDTRKRTYADLATMVPDPNLVDVFRIKYDYHNAKVLLKAEAMGSDPGRLLAAGGRYAPNLLRDAYVKGDLKNCTNAFRAAVQHAKESLAASGDPQLADFILDRAYYEELTDAAKESESEFLTGYVRLSIDVANLRSVVRAGRMGKGADLLREVLVPGGNVSERDLANLKEGELANKFRGGFLGEAAVIGAPLMSGGGDLTAFERLCDNAIVAYLSNAKRVAFGEAPVVAYLYAKEAELTAVRIILMGRLAGLDTEIIRERLRDSYV